MTQFRGDYCYELNSEDKFDLEIAIMRSRSFGGTMVMWKSTLDKYVTVIPSTSSSFLPIVVSPPGCPVSVHIAIYLPTSGKESNFMEQLILLDNCIDELTEKYVDVPIFIHGDANVNPNNTERTVLFNCFLSKFNLA